MIGEAEKVRGKELFFNLFFFVFLQLVSLKQRKQYLPAFNQTVISTMPACEFLAAALHSSFSLICPASQAPKYLKLKSYLDKTVSKRNNTTDHFLAFVGYHECFLTAS
jgi:hypothetical protein